MLRMYYISNVAKGLTARDYEDILAKARKNNQELGITGLLIVKGKFFAQALEGEHQHVMALFEKIKLDKRHEHVVMISQAEVEERIFSTWAMGFRDISFAAQFPNIDLSDPTLINSPESLDRVFRTVVEMETCA